MISAEFADKVLQLLASVGETDEVLTNLDLPLYDYQVLDSMRTVQLILMIEEEFGLKISPAEFERERWRTPRAVIADLQERRRSDGLAAYLTNRFGEDRKPIAVLGHREPEMLIAFLGAVKSGRPYVPIDTTLPRTRIDQILASSRAALSLTPDQIRRFSTAE